jgi:hypothetical protein
MDLTHHKKGHLKSEEKKWQNQEIETKSQGTL